MATPAVYAVRSLGTWGGVRTAAVLLVALVTSVASCKRKAADEESGSPTPAAVSAIAEPGVASDAGSTATEPVADEAASAARVEACLRRGQGCDELSLTESSALLQRMCREAGGTKCDKSGEDMVATLDTACRAVLGRPCTGPTDPQYQSLLDGVWGVPDCVGAQVEERAKLRFPVSLSREPLAVGAMVEVQEDTIYCNGTRSALLRERNGVRVVDEQAKAGGQASLLIDALQAQLVNHRRQLREAVSATGEPAPGGDTAVLLVDRETPTRILQEVLYTAREAGNEWIQLAVKRTAVGADPAVLPLCDRFAALSFARTAAGSAGARAREAAVTLGLAVMLTKGSMTLLAGRDVADSVLPEDPVTGTAGRVDIPHLRLSADDVARHRTTACSSAAGPGGSDCVYWTYMTAMFDSCFGDSAGEVKVPDLLQLHAALTELAGRVEAAYPQGLPDRWQLKFKAEDDIPVCQLVGILDVARFRDLGFDWTADAAFRARYDELLGEGVRAPLLDPGSFGPELRSAFLFPAVVLLD